MTPTIGRIIHIDSGDRGCVPAIITGDIVALYSSTWVEGDDPDAFKFSAALFAPTGAVGEAARRINVASDTRWHDPRDCPG